MNLPVNPLEIMKQGKSFLEEKSRRVGVGFFIDPSAQDELIELGRTTLVPQNPTARVFTEVIGSKTTLRNQRIAEMTFCVFVVGSEPSSARQEEIASRVRVAVDADCPVALVSMGGSKADLAARYGLSMLNVILLGQASEFPEALSAWAAEELKEERLALASNFIFMRHAIALEFVKATSLQNGIVGGVLFIPGADMPVMTLNQIKMVFQIAAAYDEPISKERVKEIIVVLGGAFIFRSLARQLAGMVPVIGFGIKAAVAYGGTYAMGIAALNYFEEGGSIDSLGAYLKDSRDEITERGKEYAESARQHFSKKEAEDREASLEPREPRRAKALRKLKNLRTPKDQHTRYIEVGKNDK